MTAEDPLNGGEFETAAEVEDAELNLLARRLHIAGFGQYAEDLEAADDQDVAQVAYAISDYIVDEGPTRDEEIPVLVADLRAWADRHEAQER